MRAQHVEGPSACSPTYSIQGSTPAQVSMLSAFWYVECSLARGVEVCGTRLVYRRGPFLNIPHHNSRKHVASLY